MARHQSDIFPGLPVAPVSRWTRPLVRFAELESASGVLLVAATLVALVLANSPWSERFEGVWTTHARVGVGAYTLDKPLRLWINDGLMTVFFFVVGLEIKRELVAGELRDPRKAILPLAAALGGMVVPAGVYLALQAGEAGERGWGIPMATDIAFVVGALALLGRRAPAGLKIFLLTLAIADDIGAVLVIAAAYSSGLSPVYLGLAAAGFAVTYGLNRAGVRAVGVYVLIGALIWLAVLKSGIHPTVAGVLLGLLTPARAWLGDASLTEVIRSALGRLSSAVDQGHEYRPHHLRQLAWVARERSSPLERLEASLHPWVAFAIMPLFALANAGVAVQAEMFRHPVALAVALGLFLGKPLGIFVLSWLAVRAGVARLPDGVGWMDVLGAGFLAGIGFTMSIFIAGLALEADLLSAGKLGTLIGSLASVAAGATVLAATRDKRRSPGRAASSAAPDEP